MKQNTQEWLDFRRDKIGASDAAAIMKISPWQTPYQLWENKLFGKDKEQTSAMKRGSYYEEEARGAFEKEMNLSVMPKVIVSSEREWQMASLDGVTFDGTVFTEIKVPTNKDAHELAKKGVIADHYNVQMQHQFSTDKSLQHGFFCSYWADTKEVAIVEIRKDDSLIDQMLEEEEKFYELMRTQTPPPLTDKDYAWREDLQWNDLASEWLELSRYMKQLEEQEDELREKLIALSAGQNTKGGGLRVTRTMPKGLVDYTKIPELMGVNLDLYRKPSKERWTVAACK